VDPDLCLFVKEQFRFKNTQVVNKQYTYNSKQNAIDLLLIGYELPESEIDSIRQRMEKYDLRGTKLIIRQGLNARQEIDFSQIKASIIEDVFERDSIREQAQPIGEQSIPDILDELTALYPTIRSYSASRVIQRKISGNDTLTLIVAEFAKPVKTADRIKMQMWLKTRLDADSLKLVLE